MALSIATNNAALQSAASASSVNRDIETSMARLSTGKRINAARDDAAGVAIASRLAAEIRGTDQAIRNALDGQALIDSAEGGHKEIENILQRMREISVQAANDTNDADDRSNLQAEANALMGEIDRIASVTTWAGQTLMNSEGSSFSFQVGTSNDTKSQIGVSIGAVNAAHLFPRVFENNAFSLEPTLKADGTVSVPGWTIFDEQLFLGSNGNPGTSVIAGRSTPIDPTAFPSFGGQTSGGDSNIPINTLHNRPTSTTSIEDGAIRMQSSMTTKAGGDVVRGPYIVSDDTTFIPSGSELTFEWQAKGGADAYDVFAYLINEDNGDTVLLLNESGSTSSDTAVTTASFPIDNSGNYRFVFSSGTFDYTFGRAAGASLYLDNVEIILPGLNADEIVSFSDANAATSLMTEIDTAIKTVNTQRSELGAISNRLSHTVNNLTNISSNLSAAKGVIEDADFAHETSNLAKNQILQQASTAMLAQANASKQNVLSLLQG